MKISSSERDLENVKWLVEMREEILQRWTKHISQSSSPENKKKDFENIVFAGEVK